MAYLIDLSGQTAIVTGGARGIGAAITEYFAHAGANVFITGRRSPEQVQAFVDEVEAKYGIRPCYQVCDMADTEMVKKIPENCARQFGGVDILVHNAGGGAKSYDENFVVHMKNVAALTEAAHPYLKESKEGGRIVFIGSSTSVYGGHSGIDIIPYASTKGGEIAMVRVYAREYAKDGIRINGIWPSAIMSDALIKVRGGDAKACEEHYAKQMPLGKVGMPKDIASLTLFLCCEMSSYLDGQLYMVDGGRLILS